MSTSVENLSFLRDLVYRRSAIVIQADKHYLIDSRLAPLAKEAGLESIDALVGRIRQEDASAPLVKRVIEAMTTNETLFFRDIHPFEALKNGIIPDLIKARAAQRSIRIWCAAASTGQEPYSIAMMIREHFPELDTWNVQIIATDINVAVLDRARQGAYRQLEVNRGLPIAMLMKYFDREGAEWKIKPGIRNMVKFTELNLLDAWACIGPQDVVFIRNVLIYFDVETKRRLLGRIRNLLAQDGFLVLGGAETTINIDDSYMSVKIGPGIYYKPKPSHA